MFDKLKELSKLKQLKNDAENEVFDVEKKGIKVSVNGALLVSEIILNPEIADDKQGLILKDCLNEAIKKAQMSMAKKFSGMM